MRPEARSRPALLRALTLAWIANSAFGAFLGLWYLPGVLDGAGFLPRLFAYTGLVSSVATVFLVVALVLALAIAAGVRARTFAWIQAVGWTLALVAIFADTRIYALFRYHFNGMVWNVLTTPGGDQTFEIGAVTWTFVGVGALVVLLVERALFVRLLEHATRPAWTPRKRAPKSLRYALVALLAVVLCEKTIYAASDLRRDRAVTSVARAFPLYQRLTINRFVHKTLGIRLDERAKVDVGSGAALRYPLEKPVFDDVGRRPNVLLIAIDGLRADMLAEETMPRTLAWSKEARRFDDHHSGGNATRFGIFSLFYGIHGAYWSPVYEDKAPPVLVTSLQELGHELKVWSCSSLSFPEFRSTAFVTCEEVIEDRLPFEKKHERDAEIARRFTAWISERDARADAEPFFAFAFLDSPHQTYDWPRDETHFTPYRDRMDYLKMASDPPPEEVAAVFNSYKNAVRFCDRLVGLMLDALRAAGELERTLVIVTGDHGEEFFENGYFGHTSNFTPEQTHVAFVLGGPGVTPGIERRPTSHVDVAPTLLELSGARAANRAAWCQGESLLAPPETRERVVAGWQEVALLVDGGILHVPIEGHKGLVEAYDVRWKPHPGGDAFVRAHGASIAALARACRTFLR